jgi:hypothetical protein
MTASGHSLVRAALAIYPAQAEREGWANSMAEQAEALLAAARQVGPTTSDEAYADALRAADRSVRLAQREYPSRESLAWMEAAVRELEALARVRFGATQVIVNLGYEPLPGSGARPSRVSRFGNPCE